MKEKKVIEKELNRVKEYIKGGMLLSLESTTNRMIRIANSFLYFNRVVSLDDFLKKIDSVTIEHITSCANELLDEKKLSKVILTSNNAAWLTSLKFPTKVCWMSWNLTKKVFIESVIKQSVTTTVKIPSKNYRIMQNSLFLLNNWTY